jgi:hypothetical protein
MPGARPPGRSWKWQSWGARRGQVVREAISEGDPDEAETKGIRARRSGRRYHQSQSGPVREKMKEWIERQFRERLVESSPHRRLGQAWPSWLNHGDGLRGGLPATRGPALPSRRWSGH